MDEFELESVEQIREKVKAQARLKVNPVILEIKDFIESIDEENYTDKLNIVLDKAIKIRSSEFEKSYYSSVYDHFSDIIDETLYEMYSTKTKEDVIRDVIYDMFNGVTYLGDYSNSEIIDYLGYYDKKLVCKATKKFLTDMLNTTKKKFNGGV